MRHRAPPSRPAVDPLSSRATTRKGKKFKKGRAERNAATHPQKTWPRPGVLVVILPLAALVLVFLVFRSRFHRKADSVSFVQEAQKAATPNPRTENVQGVEGAVHAAQAHATWQNAILNSDPLERNGTTRFLIYEGVKTGMGNQLEAIISAYLYAMITKRIFVLRGNKYSSAIDFPLDPIDENDSRVKRHLEIVGEKEKGVGHEEAARVCENWASEDHPLSQHRKLLLHRGNMYFADLFFYNPHIRPWLEERFGPRNLKNNPFKPLFRWFVTLKPAAQKIVDDVKRREFNGTVIGLQLRVTESFSKLEQVDTFFDCAIEKAAAELSNGGNTRFFISTDNPAVQKLAKERFAEAAFWRSDITFNISLPPKREMIGAIADVTLLSECDGLVVTQGSSFGRLAYASSISNEPPWFVTMHNKLWNARMYEPDTCRRSVTTKPCSDRVHKILLQDRTGHCLSESDKKEAYSECDNS